MYSKLSTSVKLFTLLGIVCALLLVTGIYFYYQSENEPARIVYMLPKPREERTSTPPATTFRQPVSNSIQPVSSPDVHDHHDHDYDADDYELDVPSDVAADLDESMFLSTESEESGESTNEDSNVSPVLLEQIVILTEEINEKYPEVMALQSMTPREIHELYPTPEERAALQSKAQKAREEFFDGMRPLFAKLPKDVVEENFSLARKHFAQTHGGEIADIIIAQLRAGLGL